MRERPSRLELFTFYYLGFNPAGEYRFPNAHHVARWYRVSADAVLGWLEDDELPPGQVLGRQFNLAAAQVDLQLEANELTREEFLARCAAILAEVDEARPGRRCWED